MKKTILFVCFSFLVGFLCVLPISKASAYPLSASKGSLSASVAFVVDGTNLIVTLTNTSPFDVMVPADVLTAVFFTLEGDPDLTPVSAVLGPGSIVLFDDPPLDGVVGGEWAYKDGLSGAPLGADEGIGAAGFGLFGPHDLFPGDNLINNGNVGGLDYGITSAGDDPTTGNSPVTDGPRNALIKNEVVFTLSGLPTDFELVVSNVSFQYGTDLREPNLPVPEPATMLLFGTGLIGMAAIGRRKFRKR